MTFSTFVTPTRDGSIEFGAYRGCSVWDTRGHGPRKEVDMAYTRAQVREAVERAGDEHWQALIRRHEDAYPATRPTPGDVCRAEAERLNRLPPRGGRAVSPGRAPV